MHIQEDSGGVGLLKQGLRKENQFSEPWLIWKAMNRLKAFATELKIAFSLTDKQTNKQRTHQAILQENCVFIMFFNYHETQRAKFIIVTDSKCAIQWQKVPGHSFMLTTMLVASSIWNSLPIKQLLRWLFLQLSNCPYTSVSLLLSLVLLCNWGQWNGSLIVFLGLIYLTYHPVLQFIYVVVDVRISLIFKVD